jgi:hypothetical protein
MPSSPGIGMHVEVKDPEDKTILSRVSKMSILILQFELTAGISFRRFTAPRVDSLSLLTPLVNMSSVFTPTALSGSAELNW